MVSAKSWNRQAAAIRFANVKRGHHSFRVPLESSGSFMFGQDVKFAGEKTRYYDAGVEVVS
jgi:hypothetical protein